MSNSFTIFSIDFAVDAWDLLQIRPVYRKQQENFDRVLKCVTHLIYLLVATARSCDEMKIVRIAHMSWHCRQILYPFECTTLNMYRKFRISGKRKCEKVDKKSDT